MHIKKGFHAKKGSNFSTKIDPCPETDCDCYPWDKNNTKSLKKLTINQDTINLDKTTIVNIYPNPTKNGQFYVNFDHDHEMPYNIEIYNSMGHLVYSENDIYNTTAKYDLSGVTKGLYLVIIRYDNRRKVFKLIN